MEEALDLEVVMEGMAMGEVLGLVVEMEMEEVMEMKEVSVL